MADEELFIGADPLDRAAASALSIAAGTVFQPRAPISTRELFAGRWEQITTVCDAVAQRGLHIVVFGERGVGKTSLANIIDPLLVMMEDTMTTAPSGVPRLVVKVNTHQGDSFEAVWKRAFDEVFWEQDRPIGMLSREMMSETVMLRDVFGISDAPSIDEVRRALSRMKRAVFIFDEFDRGTKELRIAFTDLIKSLSDYSIDCTIVIVGVSDTVDQLVSEHASIVRSIVQISLPRMPERELTDILVKAAKKLNVEYTADATSLIVRMSQGLPHYTHLVGLHATREAANRLSRVVGTDDVHKCFTKAVNQAVQSIRERYLRAIHSAHKDALYDKVLLACAAASSTAKDALGYFHPSDVVVPLSKVLGRDNVSIATFQKHINEFCEEQRGCVLERTGLPRAFKYRFKDPLLPPYAFMTAMAEGEIDVRRLRSLTFSE